MRRESMAGPLTGGLARRFEAVVLDGRVIERDGDMGGARIGELLEGLSRCGLHVVVAGGPDVYAVDRRLRARPPGPGRLYVVPDWGAQAFEVDEAGPHPVPPRQDPQGSADSAAMIADTLSRHGVSFGAVLVVGAPGDNPGDRAHDLLPASGSEARATWVSIGEEPGRSEGDAIRQEGSATLRALLQDQLARRSAHEVPAVDHDPLWSLAVDGFDPNLEPAHETLCTLSDGRIGTSGNPPSLHESSAPRVLAVLYDGDGARSKLLPCPLWNLAWRPLPEGAELRRVLDLRAGLLWTDVSTEEGAAQAVAFSSLARPGTAVLRTHGSPDLLDPGSSLTEPPGGSIRSAGSTDGAAWMAADASPGGVVAAGIDERRFTHDAEALDRFTAYRLDGRSRPAVADAVQAAEGARRAGFERLLVEHRDAWAQRWRGADVRIEGDDRLQRAVRFALFHLMASVSDGGEAPVGARGLSGHAYRGHVFWDADVFVLPFLAATHPRAARAMLEYRIRRLGAANRRAITQRRGGARFPWESARTGDDVTPSSARDRAGNEILVRTGEYEEHIVADVAWAAAQYEAWSGDEDFAAGPGRVLLLETARYWASRIEPDREGRGHIRGVIGPDEYHEQVDDNAYTNVMARWNLRRAASAARGPDEEAEAERWVDLAEGLVDGYDPSTGLYEQFAGFFGLEPLVIADVAPRRPIAGDLLLGYDRVHRAQVVKQADVLMLHHLVPDEVAPGSLVPNLEYYEPRTAHGSSLSPGVHASLFARAGRLAEAVEALDLTSRIDLDDLTETTAGGLHLATMGSLWQAIAFGIAGLRPQADVLEVDPRLPPRWRSLSVVVSFRSSRVLVQVDDSRVLISADRPIMVRVGDREPAHVTPTGIELPLRRQGGGRP